MNIIYKYHFLGLLCSFLSLTSCKEEKTLDVNFPQLDKAKNNLIISCIRCACIDELIRKAIEVKNEDLSTYIIWGDTTCNSGLKKIVVIHHLSQQSIDSVSEEIYNMLIIKANTNNGRIITTEIAQKEKFEVFH